MDWIDCLFPSVCIGCTRPVTSGLVCNKCDLELSAFVHPLASCNKRKSKYIDSILHIWPYKSLAGRLVKRFKFRRDFLCWEVLSKRLSEYFMQYASYFKGIGVLITYVPMPWMKKVFVRGFNQSEIMAKHCSLCLDMSVYKLVSAKLHFPQHWLATKRQRERAVQDMFRPNPKLIDKLLARGYNRVIVVDDIVTSGLTLEEIAKTLKSCGIKKVEGIALCG